MIARHLCWHHDMNSDSGPQETLRATLMMRRRRSNFIHSRHLELLLCDPYAYHTTMCKLSFLARIQGRRLQRVPRGSYDAEVDHVTFGFLVTWKELALRLSLHFSEQFQLH